MSLSPKVCPFFQKKKAKKPEESLFRRDRIGQKSTTPFLNGALQERADSDDKRGKYQLFKKGVRKKRGQKSCVGKPGRIIFCSLSSFSFGFDGGLLLTKALCFIIALIRLKKGFQNGKGKGVA